MTNPSPPDWGTASPDQPVAVDPVKVAALNAAAAFLAYPIFGYGGTSGRQDRVSPDEVLRCATQFEAYLRGAETSRRGWSS